VVQVTEVHALTRLFVDTRRHRDSITRHDFAVGVDSAGIGDVRQMGCDAQVLAQFLRSAKHVANDFERRITILFNQRPVGFG